jgi:uncharacterized protein (TIGR02611 family)
VTAQDRQTAGGSTERPNGSAVPGPDPTPDDAPEPVADVPEAVTGHGEDRPRGLSHRARVWRHGLKASPTADRAYRMVVGIVGGAIVLLGLALVPLPGPGWLIVFAGLAVLSTEFEAADRLYRFVRERVKTWTRWIARQALPVRIAAGLLSLAMVALVVYLSLISFGVPGWLPGGLVDWAPGIGD